MDEAIAELVAAAQALKAAYDGLISRYGDEAAMPGFVDQVQGITAMLNNLAADITK